MPGQRDDVARVVRQARRAGAAAVQHQHGRAGAEFGEVDLPRADRGGCERGSQGEWS